jgi:SAM-dependent methyltransferase
MAAPEPARTLPVEEARCLFCPASDTRPLASGRDYEYESSPDRFELVRCGGCGLVFLQPRPGPQAMAVIYPDDYYAYREEEAERPFVKFFRDRVERVKVRRYERLIGNGPAALVDVGCGDGRLLEIVRRFGPASWRLAGIEIGAGAARRAAGRGFEVRSGDFEEVSLAGWEESFDCALLHHVIEHVRRPREALRRLGGLLRPGGLLSIETPEVRGWDFQLFRRHYWGGYHIPRHFYLFDRDTLTRLLREEGFGIVSVRSIPSPAFWVFSVHNWLADRDWGRRLARFFQPQNVLAVGAATAIDALQILVRRQSTNLQVLARRLAP